MASSRIRGDLSEYVNSLLQRRINKLTKCAVETFEKVLNLRSSSPAFITPVYKSPETGYDKSDGEETSGLRNELRKCAHTDDYNKILKTVQDQAGKDAISVWVSDTLYADFDLPMDRTLPAGRTFQLLFLGADHPCFILTLFEDGKSSLQDAREFSSRTAQLLSLSLLRFCPREFVLLPCALSLNSLTKAALEEEVQSQMEQSRDYYKGPEQLTMDVYKDLVKAANAVVRLTNVPYLFENSDNSEEWLTLMDRDWSDVVSLFLEALANCEQCHVSWTEDTKYKVKVAALEAVRRLACLEDVTFETADTVLVDIRENLKQEAELLNIVATDKALGSGGEIHILTSKCKLVISDECFRLLLLGKTGNGKSTTGNTIFGEEVFLTNVGFGSSDTVPHFERRRINGSIVEILDCPGLYDTEDELTVCTDIVNAVIPLYPGPHAILYVLQIGRYTEEEFIVYNTLKALFDENITKHMIVLFTGGDHLEVKNEKLEDKLQTVPDSLRQVLGECGRRCIVFNNFAADKKTQVNNLFEMVRELKKQNDEKPYVCPKYETITEVLQEEVMERVKAASKHERRHPLKYKAQEPTTESAALLKSETVRGRINLGGRKPAYTCEKQMDEQIEEEYKVNRPVETQELQFTHEETRKSKDCLEQKDNDESISDKNFIEICLNNVNVMDEIRDQILEGKEKKLKTKFISKISSIIKNILKQVSAQAPRAADQ